MKLLAVTPYPPGMRGIGEYGQLILQGLDRSGAFDTITVLADRIPGAVPEERHGRVRMQRVWSRDRFDTALALQRQVRQEAPDIVWYNLGLSMFGAGRAAAFCGLAAPALTKALGFPTFVTLHEVFEAVELESVGLGNSPLNRLGGNLATRMLLAVDAVGVTLARYVDLLRARHGADNLIHLPHGALAVPTAPRGDPENGRVLMLAAHAPHKGLPVLLDACAALTDVHPDLELIVVGGDHPRFPGYLQTAKATPHPFCKVRWTGYLSEEDLTEHLAEASVVVLPSFATTGSSSVMYRAAAAGRAIVASDLPDLRAVAAEAGFAVRFVPPGDRHALTTALHDLLSDRSLRGRMAAQNARAAQSCNLEDTCTAYLRFFAAAPALATVQGTLPRRQTFL